MAHIEGEQHEATQARFREGCSCVRRVLTADDYRFMEELQAISEDAFAEKNRAERADPPEEYDPSTYRYRLETFWREHEMSELDFESRLDSIERISDAQCNVMYDFWRLRR